MAKMQDYSLVRAAQKDSRLVELLLALALNAPMPVDFFNKERFLKSKRLRHRSYPVSTFTFHNLQVFKRGWLNCFSRSVSEKTLKDYNKKNKDEFKLTLNATLYSWRQEMSKAFLEIDKLQDAPVEQLFLYHAVVRHTQNVLLILAMQKEHELVSKMGFKPNHVQGGLEELHTKLVSRFKDGTAHLAVLKQELKAARRMAYTMQQGVDYIAKRSVAFREHDLIEHPLMLLAE